MKILILQGSIADVLARFEEYGAALDENETGALNAQLFTLFTRIGFYGDYKPGMYQVHAFYNHVWYIHCVLHLL
jgi:hypothetical protein